MTVVRTLGVSLCCLAAFLCACSKNPLPETFAVSQAFSQPASPYDARAEFIALSSAEDTTEEDWLELTERALGSGDLDIASRALDQASTTLSPTRVRLERARLAAAAGDVDSAVALLQELYAEGFAAVRLVTGDEHLSGLAGNDQFDALVEDLTNRAFPCLSDESFRQFDFWIGTWKVHLPDGRFAGTNNIERAEKGCLITEHWIDASGGTGSSVNYVDKRTGEWVQVWNSENGTQIHIRGGLTPEGMRLTGEMHQVGSAETLPFRGLWTLLPDGRVRQFFEQSNDGGETWVQWFEGMYTRDDARSPGTEAN